MIKLELEIDETRSLKILIKVLNQSGLNYRLKSPNEEGGFFFIEDGQKKKFTDNIFVKRSLKIEQTQGYCNLEA